MDLVLRLQDPEDLLYQGLDRSDARFVTLRHFPRLIELAERLATLPGVAEWMAERPEDARLLRATTEVLSQWEVTYAGNIREEEEEEEDW